MGVLAYRATRTSDPAPEPITRAEAKDQARIETTADDTLVDGLIAAAREHVEEFTRRALITQTWEAYLDAFPGDNDIAIWLPRTPVQSVDSIEYIDTAGATQIWAAADYQVDTDSLPARIRPARAESYPDTHTDILQAVTITFTAGYGEASAVPNAIKHAMLLIVSHWYDNRDAVNIGNVVTPLPMAVDALLWPYRLLHP